MGPSEQEKRGVEAWSKKYVPKGAAPKCPICGTGDWSIKVQGMVQTNPDGSNPQKMPGTKFDLICRDCGLTLQIHPSQISGN